MQKEHQQAPPINIHGQGPNELKKLFIQQQKDYQYLNERTVRTKILPNNLRVVSYNVHFWLNVYATKNNENEMDEVIKACNADILVLQEYVYPQSKPTNRATLTSLGYIYNTISQAPQTDTSGFMVAIFSKLPINKATYYYLRSSERWYLEASIQLTSEEVKIFACHLDVWDETEKTREKEIIHILEQMKKEKIPHLLIGDLNSLRFADYSKETLDMIRKHDKNRDVDVCNIVTSKIEAEGYIDCFVKHSAPIPQVTTWSGRRIDYIYLSSQWNYPITGCWVYHSHASDHIPVICDFELNVDKP